MKNDIKKGGTQVPVWWRWLAYLPFTQDTGVRITVWEVCSFILVDWFFLEVHFSHRQAHTIYAQQQGGNRVIWWYLFTTYTHTYSYSLLLSLKTPHVYHTLLDASLLLITLIWGSRRLTRAVWLNLPKNRVSK